MCYDGGRHRVLRGSRKETEARGWVPEGMLELIFEKQGGAGEVRRGAGEGSYRQKEGVYRHQDLGV